MPNPEMIMIDGTKYVRADSIGKPLAKARVIVRGDRSGVFFGTLVTRNGREVTLVDSRRLWYWVGAASISELALTGPKKPADCKFPDPVQEQVILDAIEVIPCTEDACKAIDAVAPWRA